MIERMEMQKQIGHNQHYVGNSLTENKSRNAFGAVETHPEVEFKPHSVCWASRFLCDGGLLKLITELGEKYKNGQL